MKKQILKYFLLAFLLGGITNAGFAQKRNATKRNTTRKTTKTKTKANIKATTATTDTVAVSAAIELPPPENDSLPIKAVKKSLRPDEAVETTVLRERIPLLTKIYVPMMRYTAIRYGVKLIPGKRSMQLLIILPTIITVTSDLFQYYYRRYRIVLLRYSVILMTVSPHL